MSRTLGIGLLTGIHLVCIVRLLASRIGGALCCPCCLLSGLRCRIGILCLPDLAHSNDQKNQVQVPTACLSNDMSDACLWGAVSLVRLKSLDSEAVRMNASMHALLVDPTTDCLMRSP